MSYATECTGSAAVDRQSIGSGGYQPIVHMDEVYAQRFVPTSRCLDSVTVRLRRIADVDVIIEIKSDSSGVPQGLPGASILGRYRIPYTSIPKSFTNINVPFGIVLLNVSPKWIVFSSAIYDPDFYDPMELFGMDSGSISNSPEYAAFSCGTCPDAGAWRLNQNIEFYFQTYKKTYVSCTVPGCGFDVV